MRLFFLALIVSGCSALAGLPLAKVVKVSWDYSALPAGASNATYTLYKSTSLGTVSTPWKKTAITPWPRTNMNFVVLPGNYRFKLTLTAQPMRLFGESPASNIKTNIVK